MAKYFIDREVYFQGVKQCPRKVIITSMYNEPNGHTAICYDTDGDEYSIELSEIFDDNDNPIRDVRNKLGLSQEKFSKLFEIPKRTLEDWETGKSKPPKYVINMIIEKAFSML